MNVKKTRDRWRHRLEFADSLERVQCMKSRIKNILMTDRDDILFRNQMHHIENKTVLLEIRGSRRSPRPTISIARRIAW